jgi:outer membrane lipoprotein carrier protein
MTYTSARLHVCTMLWFLIVPTCSRADGAIVPTFRRTDVYQDPLAILDRASRSYDSVKTLAADFTQIIDNPMIADPDTTRGRLYQRRSNYFAMRFTEPKNDRVVADGRRLWLYTPSTTPGQVIRTTIPGTGTTGPNLIGQFVEHPRERYNASYVRADSLPDGAVDVIALTPRAKDLPYSEATVWISKQDGLVRRIEIVENSGQRRTITLSHLVVNQAIPTREFKFSPTSGVRVVDQ